MVLIIVQPIDIVIKLDSCSGCCLPKELCIVGLAIGIVPPCIIFPFHQCLQQIIHGESGWCACNCSLPAIADGILLNGIQGGAAGDGIFETILTCNRVIIYLLILILPGGDHLIHPNLPVLPLQLLLRLHFGAQIDCPHCFAVAKLQLVDVDQRRRQIIHLRLIVCSPLVLRLVGVLMLDDLLGFQPDGGRHGRRGVGHCFHRGVAIVGGHGVAAQQVLLCLYQHGAVPAPGCRDVLGIPSDSKSAIIVCADDAEFCTGIVCRGTGAVQQDLVPRIQRSAGLIHGVEGVPHAVGDVALHRGICRDLLNDLIEHIFQLIAGLSGEEHLLIPGIPIRQVVQQHRAALHIAHAEADGDQRNIVRGTQLAVSTRLQGVGGILHILAVYSPAVPLGGAVGNKHRVFWRSVGVPVEGRRICQG